MKFFIGLQNQLVYSVSPLLKDTWAFYQRQKVFDSVKNRLMSGIELKNIKSNNMRVNNKNKFCYGFVFFLSIVTFQKIWSLMIVFL